MSKTNTNKIEHVIVISFSMNCKQILLPNYK